MKYIKSIITVAVMLTIVCVCAVTPYYTGRWALNIKGEVDCLDVFACYFIGVLLDLTAACILGMVIAWGVPLYYRLYSYLWERDDG